MLTTPRTSLLLAMLLLATACSKEPAPASASGKPLVEPSAADRVPADAEEFHSSFAPGGIEASYRATFKEGKIQSLAETRKAASQTGVYEFLGARLMRYSGSALNSNETIELVFDQQGKVITRKAGDKEASVEEITAIRDRAQSLRSHAVSQYAVKRHDKL